MTSPPACSLEPSRLTDQLYQLASRERPAVRIPFPPPASPQGRTQEAHQYLEGGLLAGRAQCDRAGVVNRAADRQYRTVAAAPNPLGGDRDDLGDRRETGE